MTAEVGDYIVLKPMDEIEELRSYYQIGVNDEMEEHMRKKHLLRITRLDTMCSSRIEYFNVAEDGWTYSPDWIAKVIKPQDLII